MAEVWEEATYVKHHKKKIAFIFSAMRHFANTLEKIGHELTYYKLGEDKNTSFQSAVSQCLKQNSPEKIIVTSPSEYRVLEQVKTWRKGLGLDVEIRDDTRFLCSKKAFTTWAEGRKSLVMEYFYREMRKKYNILVENDKPTGGQWNFDKENRKVPSDKRAIPDFVKIEPDEITEAVMALVNKRFSSHFGDLDDFDYAVCREDALKLLNHFVTKLLPDFGDYQDAMVEGEPWMYHSILSMYINCGLLLPLECIKAAVEQYEKGHAPINAVEGYVRQLLGWREFVNGVYWKHMPNYKKLNHLSANNSHPDFYWTGKTKMNCLKQCVTETKQHAYAHHIQRLMVLGNFALLMGAHPDEVNEWYLIVYADAYEWVELPNVSGMTLFADGGLLGTKPYASSGAYINKMSDYCKSCHYKVKEKSGEQACPFNYLYWDFVARNKDKLSDNQRMSMIYNTYNKMSDEKREAIAHDSKTFISVLCDKKKD
jgi:deoxyribodipyrimidine photolyase-related protein